MKMYYNMIIVALGRYYGKALKARCKTGGLRTQQQSQIQLTFLKILSILRMDG